MIQIRSVLWLLLFSGLVLHMMCTSNLNFAITYMVKQKPNSHNDTFVAVCQLNSTNIIKFSEAVPSVSTGEYSWSDKEKNLVMSSFSWLMGPAKLFGGLLCQKYGGKVVFGYSKFTLALLSCFIPTAAKFDYKVVIVIRVLQGIAAGLSIGTATSILISKWVPPNERGKFASAMAGIYFGISFCYFLSGWILHWFGWRAIFYVSGFIGFVWCIIWYYFVYDDPHRHPYISKEELTLIDKTIGGAISKKQLPVPWLAIMTSVPFLVNTLCQIICSWTFFIFVLYIPTYLREIHGFRSYKMGIFSSLPYLLSTLFAIIFGSITDYLLQSKILSRTNTRKFAVLFNTILEGAVLGGLAFSNCNIVYVLTLLTLTVMLHGANLSSTTPNLIDISPNFTAVLHGIQGFITMNTGFLAPLFVGFLTNDNKSIEQWNKVFLITCVANMFSGILFLIFGDSNIQPWNYETGIEKDAAVKLLKTKESEDGKATSNK